MMLKTAFRTAFFSLAMLSAVVSADIRTVRDMAGRVVDVPFDPDRIVCVGPGALRLIVYLQAQDKVCGIEDMEKLNPEGRPYWIAHPELHGLPSCGPGGPAGINKKPDLEAVLSTAPQVIFITYMDGALADEVQRILEIPVVVLTYGPFATFDETVYHSLETAGKVLNREERAFEIREYIQFLRKDLKKRSEGKSQDARLRVYVGGIGHRGTHGIESTEKDYVPFDWIGAANVAKGLKSFMGSHVFIDKETLLHLDPDVIFIDGAGLELVVESYRRNPKLYDALKAFSMGRVYTLLPFNHYTTNIGTALADAYAVGKILHKEGFRDIDPEKKADEIYTFLVGKPVYPAMKKDYGTIGRLASFLKRH